jgi:hypothetical protein
VHVEDQIPFEAARCKIRASGGDPARFEASGALPLFGVFIMKWQMTLVLLSFSTASMIAGAQSSTEGRGLAKETQVRGYWIDPSTGLMWAGKDNGKDVKWGKAMTYCRDLRLAGYSDWRLATIDELQGIYDRSANAPGENPRSR